MLLVPAAVQAWSGAQRTRSDFNRMRTPFCSLSARLHVPALPSAILCSIELATYEYLKRVLR